MDCKQGLEALLRDRGVEYWSHYHAVAYSAQETAEKDHVSGRSFAKPVIVFADGLLKMLVVAAPDRVDLECARVAIGASDLELAHEQQFADQFPDCELGAMPPFGSLYNLSTYIDQALSEQDTIAFSAGSHTDTLVLRASDYLSCESPTVVQLRSS